MTQANQEMVELMERLRIWKKYGGIVRHEHVFYGAATGAEYRMPMYSPTTINQPEPLMSEAASAIETLLKQQEEMREKAAALVSACDGLEWNSFTEAGWKRVNDLRAFLTKPALEDKHNG